MMENFDNFELEEDVFNDEIDSFGEIDMDEVDDEDDEIDDFDKFDDEDNF
jgi:hypothetical protein